MIEFIAVALGASAVLGIGFSVGSVVIGGIVDSARDNRDKNQQKRIIKKQEKEERKAEKEERKAQKRAVKKIGKSAAEIIEMERGESERRTATADRALNDFLDYLANQKKKEKSAMAKRNKKAGQGLAAHLSTITEHEKEANEKFEKLLNTLGDLEKSATDEEKAIIESFKEAATSLYNGEKEAAIKRVAEANEAHSGIMKDEKTASSKRIEAADKAFNGFLKHLDTQKAKEKEAMAKRQKKAGENLAKLLAVYSSMEKDSTEKFNSLLEKFKSLDSESQKKFVEVMGSFEASGKTATENLGNLLDLLSSLDADARKKFSQVVSSFETERNLKSEELKAVYDSLGEEGKKELKELISGLESAGSDSLEEFKDKIMKLFSSAETSKNRFDSVLSRYSSSASHSIGELLAAISSQKTIANKELENLRLTYSDLSQDAKDALEQVVKSFKEEELENFRKSVVSMDEEAREKFDALLKEYVNYSKRGHQSLVGLIVSIAMMEDEAIKQYGAITDSLKSMDVSSKECFQKFITSLSSLESDGKQRLDSILARIEESATEKEKEIIRSFKDKIDLLYGTERRASESRLAEANEQHRKIMQSEKSASESRIVAAEAANKYYMAKEKEAHEKRMRKISPKEAIESLNSLIKNGEKEKQKFEAFLSTWLDRYCNDSNNITFVQQKIEHPETLSPAQLSIITSEKNTKEREIRTNISQYLYGIFWDKYKEAYENWNSNVQARLFKIENHKAPEDLKKFVDISIINREKYMSIIEKNIDLIAHKKYLYDTNFSSWIMWLEDCKDPKKRAHASPKYDEKLYDLVNGELAEIYKGILDNNISVEDFLASVRKRLARIDMDVQVKRDSVANDNAMKKIVETISAVENQSAEYAENVNVRIGQIEETIRGLLKGIDTKFEGINKTNSEQFNAINEKLRNLSSSIAVVSSNQKDIKKLFELLNKFDKIVKEYGLKFEELDSEIMEAVKIAEDNMSSQFRDWLETILACIVDKNNFGAYMQEVTSHLEFLREWANEFDYDEPIRNLKEKIEGLESGQLALSDTQKQDLVDLRGYLEAMIKELEKSTDNKIKKLKRATNTKIRERVPNKRTVNELSRKIRNINKLLDKLTALSAEEKAEIFKQLRDINQSLNELDISVLADANDEFISIYEAIRELDGQQKLLGGEIMETVGIAEDNMFNKFNEWLNLILDCVIDKNNFDAYISNVKDQLDFIYEWAEAQTDVEIVMQLKEKIEGLEKGQASLSESQKREVEELRKEIDERLSGLKNSFVNRLNQLGKTVAGEVNEIKKGIKKSPKMSDINRLVSELSGIKESIGKIGDVDASIDAKIEQITVVIRLWLQSWKDAALEVLHEDNQQFIGQVINDINELKESIRILSQEDIKALLEALARFSTDEKCSEDLRRSVIKTGVSLRGITEKTWVTEAEIPKGTRK